MARDVNQSAPVPKSDPDSDSLGFNRQESRGDRAFQHKILRFSKISWTILLLWSNNCVETPEQIRPVNIIC
jgi:hypothetical protein